MKDYRIEIAHMDVVRDVANKTGLRSQWKEAAGASTADASSVSSADDSDSALFQAERSIDSALSRLSSVAGEYVAGTSDGDGVTELLLCLPDNCDTGAAAKLSEAVHAYVVASVTGDWYVVTCREDADVWTATAANCLETVLRIVHSRRRPDACRRRVE